MIVKEKILIEFDVNTISGAIYPKELLPSILNSVLKDNIGCVIAENKEDLDKIDLENPSAQYVAHIFNPKCVVDETVEVPILTMLCDVNFDEEKLTKEMIEKIKNGKWRLGINGYGNVDENNKVTDYELKFIIIEFVDEKWYNSENNVKGNE